MATAPNLPEKAAESPNRDSRTVILGSASNELVFAVVGHAGSGTTVIAEALAARLIETEIGGHKFDVKVLKARDVIGDWAIRHGKPLPPQRDGKRSLEEVRRYQDLGDEMRGQKTTTGGPDHAAVARGLVVKIRETRAAQQGVEAKQGEPVPPDGKPRAYVLDSIRHPAEVNLLRSIYRDAFVLIGVVCEERKRVTRISRKYADAGEHNALRFMERDAGATEGHGQQVAKAFHLSDFFVDNTVDRTLPDGQSNVGWDVNEHMSRLVKILTHDGLKRPTISETAMHHASSAQMRSACLSRQVGASLVDAKGNIVATGTNEVPKAGGGVYGEEFSDGNQPEDSRCGMLAEGQRYCRNTKAQNEIIRELIENVPELRNADAIRQTQLPSELRKTKIGLLLEFSRAVHAELDAILSAARQGVMLSGTRLFVTTFPCHYCARHIVTAGIDEVQYIEPYPKSQALDLHSDAIQVESTGWQPPSAGTGGRVLFRPFSGIAPRFYKKAFLKERDLKNSETGEMSVGTPSWGQPWHLGKTSYVELEAELTKTEDTVWKAKPSAGSK